MSRRYVLVALLALGLAACPNRSPSPDFSPTGLQIHATKTKTFDPVTLTITKGTTISWDNTTGIGHNVTFENGPAFNKPLNNDMYFDRKFTTVGTFNYFCAIHGRSMHGTVVVT
jgi:plastocyanin